MSGGGSIALPIGGVCRETHNLRQANTPLKSNNREQPKDLEDLRQEVEVLRREQRAQRALIDAQWSDLLPMCEDTLTQRLALLLDASEKRLRDEMKKDIKSCTEEVERLCEAVQINLTQQFTSTLANQRAEIETALNESFVGALEVERTARFQELTDTHSAVIACVEEERVARLEGFNSLSSYLLTCRATPGAFPRTDENSLGSVSTGGLSDVNEMLQQQASESPSKHTGATPEVRSQASASLAALLLEVARANGPANGAGDNAAGNTAIQGDQATEAALLARGRPLRQALGPAPRLPMPGSARGGAGFQGSPR